MPATKVVDWATTLQPHLPVPIVSVKARQLQSLWAGYGSVSALTVQLQGQSRAEQLIAKEVRPPRDSGVGHERKVKSYEVEAAFYSAVAPGLLEATGLGLPRPVAVEGGVRGQVAGQPGLTLVLSDLRPEFPQGAPGSLDLQQARVVLDWLAAYHARFWERPTPEGLQPQGTYWYLDTRREEYGRMGRQWADLKAVAEKLDERLKAGGSQEFMTVVHGDTKGENILFSEDYSRCALYDFQYTGRSYGVRDVAYLLTSSVDSSDLERGYEGLMDHYHKQLSSQLSRQHGASGSAAAARYTPAVMRAHMDLALLDYVRFMAGWGMWGSGCEWAVARARALLPRVGELLRK
ncbi:hypothetical protein HYH03_001906 [Edaphochlamys debaryana]|uniref:CHK kinase-like domain-containing protein n=1 Tax=Edaphochlamys debaryana TaxID=47281 RepID=A0A835YKN8_9CHLO|nr:hypothetical protein HYH03_001906 [Edaphochlamys debaryana]|eukprot:KAG2500330.1 hypothetical protein HYH03_001906 [Edaphochlamys debaryana]